MTKPINVTAATFEDEILGAETPVIVDFWAPWCGPCRQLGPVLENLADKYEGDLKVAKINTQEERELAAAFQITSIPHMAIFYKRLMIGTFTGYAGPAGTEELFKNVISAKSDLDGDEEFLAKVKEAEALRDQRAAELSADGGQAEAEA